MDNENNNIITNTEMNAKDKLMEQLQQGVKSVLDSDNFKSFLETSGRLYYNNYSMNNAILVWCQRSNASHVMGYEAWKEYGRNVNAGAKGIKILKPVMAYEKEKGGLFSIVKRNLQKELNEHPQLSVATHWIGQTKMEFTMNRATRQIGLRVDGQEKMIFPSEEACKTYIDRAIIGKVPTYYTAGTVFDVKDTHKPEFLWVRQGFKKEEVALDASGKAITNKKGETKIRNTAARRAKYNPYLDMKMAAHDPEKMKVLFKVCMDVSTKSGVEVLEKTREEDGVLAGGALGYYRRPSSENASIGQNGLIVMNKDLSPTEKATVMLHEMAHSRLHKDLSKLSADMGEDRIGVSMREAQAEGVGYMVATTFGLQADKHSFNYIAMYAKGFEAQELDKSLDVIYKGAQGIIKDIQKELESQGYNLDLTKASDKLQDHLIVYDVYENNYRLALNEGMAIERAEEALRWNYLNNPKFLSQPLTVDNNVAVASIEKMYENLRVRKELVPILANAADELFTARGRAEQDECMDILQQTREQLKVYDAEYDYLLDKIKGYNTHYMADPNEIKKALFDEDYHQAYTLTASRASLAAMTERGLQDIKTDITQNRSADASNVTLSTKADGSALKDVRE